MSEPVIYTIQGAHGGPVKVGYCTRSEGVRARLGELQVGHPYQLVVRRIRPGTRDDERRVHEQLAEYRMVGEWFLCTPEVAMVTGAPLPAKEDPGRQFMPLIESVFNAGMERGRRQAEAKARQDLRSWLASARRFFAVEDYLDESFDPGCEDEIVERIARDACKAAGIPYPETAPPSAPRELRNAA